MYYFHHFGLAVKKFEKAQSFYKNMGYVFSDVVFDPLQKVELTLGILHGHPSIELVKPVDTSSPVQNYLAKNNEMIYHTCYEIDQYDDLNDLFNGTRSICVSSPKPAVLFDGREVSFYYLSGVGLVEVLKK